MTKTHPMKTTGFSASRSGLICTMSLIAILAQGCARDPQTTGAIPDDYRTRHPITLSEAQHSLDIPVSPADHKLTTAMADNVKGFAQSYTATSTGVVQIQVPTGSPNSATASLLKRQIRSALVSSGVPGNKIVEVPYGASPYGDAAPIRLSYIAVTAMTGQCGQWPEDLSNNTYSNKNWYNFGCASQNNLAAQVANPMDLVGPRGMSPIDAERRSTVIDNYRAGKTTVTSEN
ncbi:CpaD family pilus assembly protein [uncultured Agrobacterium sp.]|uniref:CpaD family pilus assembly protein n=1 Tax=uncultured Agrobacterium sp. TaxID=157277 RepID=UPI00258A7F46|nr:CpaD family pilus assembly protein [uncultured Agrobacterium sp.]